MLDWFQLVGKDLFLAGINNSHSGNLSIRQGGKVIITRTGAMLGHLEATDLVETGLEQDDANTGRASMELPVHRAIYQATEAQAIVHAHPIFATATSLVDEVITPVDGEGAFLLGQVPMLKVQNTIASDEVAAKLPVLLKEYKIVMVKGHGSFAIGKTLEEAFKYTNSLENSCKIAYYAKTLRNNTL